MLRACGTSFMAWLPQARSLSVSASKAAQAWLLAGQAAMKWARQGSGIHGHWQTSHRVGSPRQASLSYPAHATHGQYLGDSCQGRTEAGEMEAPQALGALQQGILLALRDLLSARALSRLLHGWQVLRVCCHAERCCAEGRCGESCGQPWPACRVLATAAAKLTGTWLLGCTPRRSMCASELDQHCPDCSQVVIAAEAATAVHAV